MEKETDKRLKGLEKILAILAGCGLFIIFIYLLYKEIVRAGLNGISIPIL